MEFLKVLSVCGIFLFLCSSHVLMYWLGIKQSEKINATAVAEENLRKFDGLLKQHAKIIYSRNSIKQSLENLDKMADKEWEKIYSNESIEESVKLIDELFKDHFKKVYSNNSSLLCENSIAMFDEIEKSVNKTIEVLNNLRETPNKFDNDVDRWNGVLNFAANGAKCMPELQPVPIESTDPAVVYFPRCTRIKRCGGCCDSPLVSCQPKDMITKTVTVEAHQLVSEGRSIESKKNIDLDEHINCKCECVIKPEDCTDKQTYKHDECRCA